MRGRRLAGDRRGRSPPAALARRPHRDRAAGPHAGRPPAGARVPVRHEPRAARRDRRARAPAGLCAPPAPVSLRPGRLQARLGARRLRSRGATPLPARRRPCTSAARSRRSPPREARACGAASTRRGRSSCCASRASSTAPGARRQAHRLGLLPRAGRLDVDMTDVDRARRSSASRRASAIASSRVTRRARRTSSATTRTTSAAPSPAASPTCGQLFTRPVARLDPYTTPNPRCSSARRRRRPGGGVHGMCGYHAARAALRRLPRLRPTALTV